MHLLWLMNNVLCAQQFSHWKDKRFLETQVIPPIQREHPHVNLSALRHFLFLEKILLVLLFSKKLLLPVTKIGRPKNSPFGFLLSRILYRLLRESFSFAPLVTFLRYQEFELKPDVR